MRMKPIVAGNWKMNKTIDEALSFVDEVKNRILDKDGANVIFCPPFTSLFSIARLLDNSLFYLGAQNVHHETEGAYTGEISVQMLNSVNVDYAILGHSERRIFFGETNEFIRKKINAVLKGGLIPIVCIGESLDERNAGQTKEVLKKQIEDCFNNLKSINEYSLILAYEPIWAIGTGNSANEIQITEAHGYIRRIIHTMFGENDQNIPILYGGSVNVDNALSLINIDGVDGFLVGGASLNLESFCRIIELVTDNYKRGLLC